MSPAAKACRTSRWAGTFSPGWSYKLELKVSLVPDTKNTETKFKFRARSKVVSLLVSTKQFALGKDPVFSSDAHADTVDHVRNQLANATADGPRTLYFF